MTDTVSAPTLEVAVAASSAKGKKTAKTKKTTGQKKPATHPPTSEMVNDAIKNLKERGGSSLQAIKKYVSATYKVDADKLAPFIKKYLKSAVISGALVQTKGKGAAGSFKLSDGTKENKTTKKPAADKPKKAPAKEKKAKAATKKLKSPKKPKNIAVKPKKESAPAKEKKPKAAAKPKSPKTKKAAAKPKATKSKAQKK